MPSSRVLELSVTPSVAGTIFGALEYLTSFPYGCTEQTMSSFLPNVIVSQAVKELQLKSKIDPAELEKKVRAGLDRLLRLSARRRRLGLVEDRRQPSVHDGLRGRGPGAGARPRATT